MLILRTAPHIPRMNTKIVVCEGQSSNLFVNSRAFKAQSVPVKTGNLSHHRRRRNASKTVQAIVSARDDVEVRPSSASANDFDFMTTAADEGRELKISIEVSASKTKEMFEAVFSKMVDDAQPIPGFRRVKGGKTPNIPKDILMEILGHSNVYEKVVKKLINTAIAEYVAKEDLQVGEDLRIEQSLEDLEAEIERGGSFRFVAFIQRRDSKEVVAKALN